MIRPIVTCLGVCHRDVELAALWLRWMLFLEKHSGVARGPVLVVYTKRTKPAPLYEATKGAKYLTIVQCPDEDEGGYPRSASHLFLRTLEGAEKLFPGHAPLWCESDTVLLRPTWYEEIYAEYQTCGKPFLGAKVGTRFPHLAGNSVYPHDWRELAPTIANVLSAPDYVLWGFQKGQPWDVWCRNETTPQMAESRLWNHVWKERLLRPTRPADIPVSACIHHQEKTPSLMFEIAKQQFPEFLDTLCVPERYFVMNGHESRLKSLGFRFTPTRKSHGPGGWRIMFDTRTMTPTDAATLCVMGGNNGISEISEAEFSRVVRQA